MLPDNFKAVPVHGLVRDWLGQEAVDRLLAHAQSSEHLFKNSDVLFGNIRRVDPTRRVSKKLLDLGDLKSEVETKVRHLLPAILEKLDYRPFTPKFDLELIAHGDGAFLHRHVDAFKENITSHRAISLVYYFHRLPKAFSGGVLRIYSPDQTNEPDSFVDIAPDNDSLVFFPSWVPHEVLPVRCPSGQFLDSRFAVNCWLSRSAPN